MSAASLRPGSMQSPGSLSTVFGDFPGVVTTVAHSLPLPETLGGAQVFVGGSERRFCMPLRGRSTFNSRPDRWPLGRPWRCGVAEK